MRQKMSQSAHKVPPPGPGSYVTENNLACGTKPGSVFGKDSRRSDFFLNTASYKKQEPGRYEIKGFAGNEGTGVPKFSFSKDLRAG